MLSTLKADNNSVSNITSTGMTYAFNNVTSNHTLAATFTAENYTITYNDGTVSGNPTSYNVTTATFTLKNPTKTGYVFKGWTGSNGTTPSTSVTIPKGSTGNKTYTANWVLYGDADEDGVVDSDDALLTQSYANGEAVEINEEAANVFVDNNIDKFDAMLILKHSLIPNTYPVPHTCGSYTVSYTQKDGTYHTVKYNCKCGGLKLTQDEEHTFVNGTCSICGYTFQWNAPKLATGLTPVNWNGSAWTTTTEANWDYNYNSVATATHSTVAGNGNGKWANAQTADGSLYVWIPRYSYMIESGYHSDVDSWNSLDTPGTGKILVQFSNGTTDNITSGATNASEGYIAHPAFTFGNDELTGIWVAKFEASKNDATITSEGSGTIVTFKPDVISWSNISASQMFDYSYSLNRTLDSHLMKNVEWGAVAYLTNAIGRIPYVNDSYYITGNCGSTQDAQSRSGMSGKWKTNTGVKASTTHNVYGIYDMSGGRSEYVSSYYTEADSTYLSEDTTNKAYAGSLYTAANTTAKAKYVDVYSNPYSAMNVGDAVYETCINDYNTLGQGGFSWDGDLSSLLDVSVYGSGYGVVFSRGGAYDSNVAAGIYSFGSPKGTAASNGFRVVLAIP